jgi:multiple sugar transport system substrate-binding protein
MSVRRSGVLTLLCVQTIVLMVLYGVSASASRSVKLIMQYQGSVQATESAMQWIAEFEAENPGVKVEYQPPPQGFSSRTLVAWATGNGPDVSHVCCDWGQDWARSGVLLDLRPYVKRDFKQRDQRDFWPIAWDASFVSTGTYKGTQYCLPRYAITLLNYHNKDHFTAAGLPTPNDYDARGEWTYDTLRQVARKLTLLDGEGRVTRYGFTLNTGDYRRLNVWARAFGGDFFEINAPDRFLGVEEAAVEAMDFLQEMIWQDRSTSRSFIYRSFYTGNVSMVEEGNHAVFTRFDTEIGGGFHWDLAPAVKGISGRQSYTADNGWVIWRDSPHVEEAWRLVKFLTSTRGQEIMVSNEGIAPVRQSAMGAYLKLAPHLNASGAHVTNMLDPSLPTTTFLTGDVGGISRTLNKALGDVLIRNEKSWAVAASEIKETIEALARQK